MGYSFSTTCGYILSISILFFIPHRILQAHDEALELATDCQTHKSLSHSRLVGETSCTGSPLEPLQQEDQKKHKIDGLAAAVKPTISLLKVSDIETGAPPSPCTNYGKLVKS